MPAFAARKVATRRESSFNQTNATINNTNGAIINGITSATIEWADRSKQKRYLTGNLVPATVFEQMAEGAKLQIAGDMTIEDVVMLLDSAVVATTGAGTSAPYTWSFPFPVSSAPSLKTRTIEIHDGSSSTGYMARGALVTSFQLAGTAGMDNVVTFTSTWDACKVEASTPSITNTRTFTRLPTGKIALYVDTAGGTIGTTAADATLIGWTLAVSNLAHLKRFQSGSLQPSAYGVNVPDITLTTQVEVNSTSYGWINANLTPGAVRLLQISGTSTTNKALAIKGPFDPITIAPVFGEDRDGNAIVSITWKPRLDDSTTNGGYTNSLGGIYVTSTTNAHPDA